MHHSVKIIVFKLKFDECYRICHYQSWHLAHGFDVNKLFCFLKKKSKISTPISWSTKPILGMFVLIGLHFEFWNKNMITKVENVLTVWWHFYDVVCISAINLIWESLCLHGMWHCFPVSYPSFLFLLNGEFCFWYTSWQY